jgi:ParB-like chromosome segregation protein Spo0J
MASLTAPYQVLPPLNPDDLERLKTSIIERGVEVAVVVDEAGAIIDGHHRAMIADSLGIDYPTTIRVGLAEHEKRLLSVELNLARRHLTDAQKVIAGEAVEPDVAEAARSRMAKAGAKASPGKPATDVAPIPPERTVNEVARTVGFGSGRTYERAKETLSKVKEVAPDLVPFAKNGDLTLRELRKEITAREKEQRRVEHAQERAATDRVIEAADDDGEWERTRLREQVGRVLGNLSKLNAFNPESVGELADDAKFRFDLTNTFRWHREWMAKVESAMPSGLRVVS